MNQSGTAVKGKNMQSQVKTKSQRLGKIEAIDLPDTSGMDFLIYAFSRIGGSAEAAARELGITVRKVYSILRRGVGDLPFRQFADISKRSGVPMQLAENRATGVRVEELADKSQLKEDRKQWNQHRISEQRPQSSKSKSPSGLVNIFATARDRLNILSVDHSSPSVMVTMERRADRWEPTSTPTYSIGWKPSTPVPAALTDELVTLGRDWAKAHPEEFGRAGNREFSSMIGSFDEAFDQLVEELQETENDFRGMLAEPEFLRQAPALLRSIVEDAAKMVHAMRLQTEAAAEALADAAADAVERPRPILRLV
jgi:hypothetical protein